jgi:hypothetical protein
MTATELSKKLGITIEMLQQWEESFAEWLQDDYKEGETYTKKSLKYFMVIKYLIQERGFTPEGALKEIRRRENLDEEQIDLIQKLQDIRDFLADLRSSLD